MNNRAYRGTFLPTPTNLVGGDLNEHPTILSNGFDGGAMDAARGAASTPEMAPGRAGASPVRLTLRAQGDLVATQARLSVAQGALGVWQVEYGLCVLQALARDGGMGEAEGGSAAV